MLDSTCCCCAILQAIAIDLDMQTVSRYANCLCLKIWQLSLLSIFKFQDFVKKQKEKRNIIGPQGAVNNVWQQMPV